VATTTTLKAIRDNYATLIEVLTPAVVPEYPFRRAPRDQSFQSYVLASGSGAFRAFVLSIDDQDVDPQMSPFDSVERNEALLLTMSYPVNVPALYGVADRDDMEWTMRRDARQIRDLLFSTSSYLPGQSAGFPERLPYDRSDGRVWFLELRILTIYTEAQSLT
jgi:hypothetical protein